jgi:hypothetical protein
MRVYADVCVELRQELHKPQLAALRRALQSRCSAAATSRSDPECGHHRRETTMSMGIQRRIRHKFFEWLRRYAPNEIAGWVAQSGAAAATYALTGSYAAAVIAATIGASAGYYAAAYFNGLRWSYRAQAGRSWPMRVLVANGLAARSIAVEFGPAEAIDSVTIRPIALYLGPLVVGNTAVGFVLGSIVADIAFYVMAIFSYERFTNLLARPQPARVPA